MKTNVNNRYYCFRKLDESIRKTKPKSRTIFIPMGAELNCKYAIRLRDVYRFNVQFEITTN